MINLKHTTDPQVVRIPANGEKLDGVLVLEMVNTIDRGAGRSFDYDRHVYLVDALGDYVHDADGRQVAAFAQAEASRLYYVVRVALPEDMPAGEYEYTARIGDTVVSTGLAIVALTGADTDEYKNSIEYEQYND